MKIQVPDEIFSIQKWEATVESNKMLQPSLKNLVLKLPEGENLDFQSRRLYSN